MMTYKRKHLTEAETNHLEIQADTKAFLEAGGQVTCIERGVTGEDPKNLSTAPKKKNGVNRFFNHHPKWDTVHEN